MLKLFEAIFLSSISFSAFAQTCEKTGGINNGSSSGTQITIAKRFGVTPSGPYNQVFVTQGTASFGLQLDLIRCGSLYRAYSSNKNLVGPTLGNPNGDKRTIVTTITSSGVVKIQENVVLNTFGGQGLCSDGSLPPSVATERNTTTWNLPQLTANSTKIRTYSSKCKTPTLDYTWGYVTVVRASGIFTQSNYFPFTTPPNINIDVLSTDQAESSIVFHTISVDAQDSLKIRVTSTSNAPAFLEIVPATSNGLPAGLITPITNVITNWQPVGQTYYADVLLSVRETDQWPSDGGHLASLRVNQLSLSASTDLKISARPLALVHGLWSNPDVWNAGKQYFERTSPAPSVIAIDYKTHNGSAFTNPKILNSLSGQLQNERIRLRKAGFLVNQFDVVGHSMGGLITKVFTTRPNYISDLNRNKGDIGRLVTVGTPTQGSELAAYLADHVSQPLIPKPISELFGALTVGNLLERAGMTVNCGEPKCAIQSLRPGSSELAIAAGSNLASFGVRGLAPESSNVESALNALLATFSNTTIDGLLGSSHDTIVSLTSQNSSATSQINVEAVHAETPLNWLYGLGGMGVPVETTAEVSLDAINCHLYKKTCSTLGVVRTSYIGKDTVLSNQFLSLDLSTRVKIPQTALIFSPDLPDEIGVASTINTRVSTADGQVEGIYYTNGEFGLKFLTGQNLLGVDLTSEPLVKIYGIVLISGNKYATFSKNILRIPVGSPTAILSNADEISLSQGQRFPLEVIAVYGNKTLDVTDFVSISEAGNLIATQARDIVALNTGNGIIKIMFSGQEITIPINITPGLNIFYNGFE